MIVDLGLRESNLVRANEKLKPLLELAVHDHRDGSDF
jgi:hypothetical protein